MIRDELKLFKLQFVDEARAFESKTSTFSHCRFGTRECARELQVDGDVQNSVKKRMRIVDTRATATKMPACLPLNYEEQRLIMRAKLAGWLLLIEMCVLWAAKKRRATRGAAYC